MKIIVQNLATEYQDKGTGPIILFLHGWQDNLHTFDALIKTIPNGWRIIRLDLPGFGRTERPKSPWNLDDYVEFVQAFIQKLKLKTTVLVGHSFGGRIIIKGIANKTFQADKIVLIAPAGITKRHNLRNPILNMLAKTGKLITCIPPFIFWRQQLRKKIYEKLGSDYLGAGALKKTFLKIIAEDLSLSTKNILQPTLLIWGVNDNLTPLADGKRLTKLIQDSRLAIIKNAGHFVHREKPKEVAKLIQKFI